MKHTTHSLEINLALNVGGKLGKMPDMRGPRLHKAAGF